MSDLSEIAVNKDLDALKKAATIVTDFAKAAIAAYFGGFGAVGALFGLISDVLSSFNDLTGKINELVMAIDDLYGEVKDILVLFNRRTIDLAKIDADTVWQRFQLDPRPRLNPDGSVDSDYARDQLDTCEITLTALTEASPALVSTDVNDPDPTMNDFWLNPYSVLQHFLYVRINNFGIPGMGSDNPSEKPLPGVTSLAVAGFQFTYPTSPPPPNDFGPPGILQPSPDSDDKRFVFNHIYVLPVFLRALGIYFTVGAVLLPTFIVERIEFIRKYTRFLARVHDKIALQGIAQLCPPTPGDIFSLYDPDFPPYLDRNAYDAAPYHLDDQGFLVSGFWRLPVPQPFGAVELYSGKPALLSYPKIRFDSASFVDVRPDEVPNWSPGMQRVSPEWLLRFYSKYRLRSLACAKLLYQQIGLPELRATINASCAMVGDPPLLGSPCYCDWSLREVFSAIISPIPLSLRELIAFIEAAPPPDPVRPTGLRAALIGDVRVQLATAMEI